jgi:hypothetical protein
MHQKFLMILVILASLTGFISSARSAESNALSNTAKVRVFQIGDITLYPGEFCYGSNSPAAIQAAKSGFGIFSTHKRVGMPVTEDIVGSYNEYTIPAGTVMAVMMKWEVQRGGAKTICGPTGAAFLPQAGKNYDVTISNTGQCFAQIRELYETSPGKAFALQTPASPSFPCPGK